MCIFGVLLKLKSLDMRKPKIRYINTRTPQGVETLDSVSSEDFPNKKDFKEEINSLLREYRLGGQIVWVSQRAANV